MNSCQHAAQLFSAIFAVIAIVNVLSFYGWRRSKGSLRTAFFVSFIVCSLLVLDVFVLAAVTSFLPPPPGPQICR